jgi:hypothetical protein
MKIIESTNACYEKVAGCRNFTEFAPVIFVVIWKNAYICLHE